MGVSNSNESAHVSTQAKQMKIWAMRFLLLMTLFLSGSATLNYSGYCMAQKRWLSDDDFFETALKNEAKQKWMEIDGSDASIKTFLKQNPQCCRLYKTAVDNNLENFIGKLLGTYYVNVEVQYKLNSSVTPAIGENRPAVGMKGDYYQAFFDFTNCGRRAHSYGMNIKKTESRYQDSN